MTKVVEINADTNETIERDLTAEEIADRAKNLANYEARIKAAEAKDAAKKNLLDRLGITEEEAALLLG